MKRFVSLFALIATAALAAGSGTINYTGDLAGAIDFIAKKGGLNVMVKGPRLTSSVQLSLSESSAEDALKTLALAQGLTLTQRGNVFIVTAPPEQPKDDAPSKLPVVRVANGAGKSVRSVRTVVVAPPLPPAILRSIPVGANANDPGGVFTAGSCDLANRGAIHELCSAHCGSDARCLAECEASDIACRIASLGLEDGGDHKSLVGILAKLTGAKFTFSDGKTTLSTDSNGRTTFSTEAVDPLAPSGDEGDSEAGVARADSDAGGEEAAASREDTEAEDTEAVDASDGAGDEDYVGDNLDRVATGKPIRIPANGHAGALVSYGAPIIIGEDATVDGDVVALGGDVIVKSGAIVRGDAVAVGGNIVRSPSAEIRGESVSVGSEGLGSLISSGILRSKGIVGRDRNAPKDNARNRHPFGNQAASFLMEFAVLFGTGFLLLMFVPRRMRRVASMIRAEPLKNGVSGLFAVVAAVPISLLLVVSILGIPLFFLLWLAIVLGVIAGSVAFAYEVGNRLPTFEISRTKALALSGLAFILVAQKTAGVAGFASGLFAAGATMVLCRFACVWNRIGSRMPEELPQAIALALGVFALVLVTRVPGFGALASIAIGLIALGAVTRTRFGQSPNGTPILESDPISSQY